MTTSTKNLAILLSACLLAVLAGCGGGGGSNGFSGTGGGGGTTGSGGGTGGGTNNTKAVVDAAKGFEAYARSLSLGSFTTGGNAKLSKSTPRSVLLKYAKIVLKSRGEQQATNGWQYDSDLQLYYAVTDQRSGYAYISLSTSPSGNGNAGYIQATASATNGSYPVHINLSWRITGGVFVSSGQENATFYDSSLQNYDLNGSYSTQSPYAQLSFRLAFRTNSVSGQVSAQVNSDYLTYTFIEDSRGLNISFVGTYGRGQIQENADGSGYAYLLGSGGNIVEQVSWNSSGYATVTDGNGHVVEQGYLSNL